MIDTVGLGDFHFLRPWWLLLILFALALHWRLRRAFDIADQWRGSIAPHLLEHLIVGGRNRRRLRPYQLLTLIYIGAALALAGPTWRREVTPFTIDRAPLIVILEVTESMLVSDQPPTRLERARQKIRDLLTRRAGARTAVVAYAGSAHAVLPLTDDTELITLYLESLAPALMPVAGDRPDKALELAQRMLDGEAAAGTVLFMTDGIDAEYADQFAATSAASGDQQLFLTFGLTSAEARGEAPRAAGFPSRAAPGPGEEAPEEPALPNALNLQGLEAVATASGGVLLRSTADRSDVGRLLRDVRAHLTSVAAEDAKLRWYDAGYYLVWPLSLLVLLWFRRGWTVQWR